MENMTNYQAILNWSLKHHDGTKESKKTMSEEDKAWLQDAMENMVDEVSEMKKCATILQKPEPSNDEELQEKINALEVLEDYIDSIDNARDLHLIGGFVPLINTISSTHEALQWRAAQVFAYVVQNNPQLQDWAIEFGAFPHLFKVFDVPWLTAEELKLETDAVEAGSTTAVTEGGKKLAGEVPMHAGREFSKVHVKALLALSCLVRSHDNARKVFLGRGGILVLRLAMGSPDRVLQKKAMFFLRSLASSDASVCSTAGTVGMIPLIVQALLPAADDVDLRENAVLLLTQLCRECSANVAKLQDCGKEAELSEAVRAAGAEAGDQEDAAGLTALLTYLTAA